MLIQFSDGNGTPVFINPRYVIAVREDRHSGRPGIGSDAEYRDTLILTTKYEFNVREAPDVVAAEVGRAVLSAPAAGGRADAESG